jgi:hypothetical protein
MRGIVNLAPTPIRRWTNYKQRTITQPCDAAASSGRNIMQILIVYFGIRVVPSHMERRGSRSFRGQHGKQSAGIFIYVWNNKFLIRYLMNFVSFDSRETVHVVLSYIALLDVFMIRAKFCFLIREKYVRWSEYTFSIFCRRARPVLPVLSDPYKKPLAQLSLQANLLHATFICIGVINILFLFKVKSLRYRQVSCKPIRLALTYVSRRCVPCPCIATSMIKCIV